jgi:hypothetical protein
VIDGPRPAPPRAADGMVTVWSELLAFRGVPYGGG